MGLFDWFKDDDKHDEDMKIALNELGNLWRADMTADNRMFPINFFGKRSEYIEILKKHLPPARYRCDDAVFSLIMQQNKTKDGFEIIYNVNTKVPAADGLKDEDKEKMEKAGKAAIAVGKIAIGL